MLAPIQVRKGVRWTIRKVTMSTTIPKMPKQIRPTWVFSMKG